MNNITIAQFESYSTTIPEILKKFALDRILAHEKQILIKPNLTINLPHPVTTPVALVEEVVRFCQTYSQAKIIIAEGAGGCDTSLCFHELGYSKLAEKYQLELLDLNKAKRDPKSNPDALKLKKVALPKVAFESYIINLPVLKVHGAAKLTAAMKNVFGFYLNSQYLFKGLGWLASRGFGWWNKSELHILGLNESISDLNQYINFDFNLVDATIGQYDGEIHGTSVNPPINKMIAGFDPKEVDRACAPLLNLDVNKIGYLK